MPYFSAAGGVKFILIYWRISVILFYFWRIFGTHIGWRTFLGQNSSPRSGIGHFWPKVSRTFTPTFGSNIETDSRGAFAALYHVPRGAGVQASGTAPVGTHCSSGVCPPLSCLLLASLHDPRCGCVQMLSLFDNGPRLLAMSVSYL